MDTGPVFGTVTEKIADDDTAGSLLGRLSSSGAGLLAATLDGIADGSLEAVPQPSEGVSVAPKVTVEDARVRWTDPPLAIDRTVRSVTPAPGAWTEFRGQRVKIGPVTTTGFDDLAPGELRVEKRRVLVGTAGGARRPRHRAARRQARDARRRLDARRPAGTGGAVLVTGAERRDGGRMTDSSVPPGGHRSGRGPRRSARRSPTAPARPGDAPARAAHRRATRPARPRSTRCAPSARTTPTPT